MKKMPYLIKEFINFLTLENFKKFKNFLENMNEPIIPLRRTHNFPEPEIENYAESDEDEKSDE